MTKLRDEIIAFSQTSSNHVIENDVPESSKTTIAITRATTTTPEKTSLIPPSIALPTTTERSKFISIKHYVSSRYYINYLEVDFYSWCLNDL